MPESIQHKLDRVRRPRVQITYDVETLGSIVKTELPFVVGIMADLSGNSIAGSTPKATQPLLKDRKYVEIDRDNFNAIMENVKPTVKLVETTGDELTFTSLEDFDPINVLSQVSKLRGWFESRTRLSNLVAKLDGNVALQKEFIDAYNDLMKDKAASTELKTYFDFVKNPPPQETPLSPGTMRITPAETTGVNQTTSGLVVTLDPKDVNKVVSFQISDIKGGKVFKTDGKKASEIAEGGKVKVADVAGGFKFTPEADNTEGSFKVTALGENEKPLSPDISETAKITVKKEGK